MYEECFKDLTVVKRSGQRVLFDGTKIAVAIKGAFDDINTNYSENDINKVYFDVLSFIKEQYSDRKTINVEDIQDIIEEILLKDKYQEIYDAFNTYRLRRSASREIFEKKQQHKFVKAIEKFGFQTENEFYSNPIQTLNNFGKTVSREFSNAYLIENKYVRSHEEGYIYIKNLDYYSIGSPSMICLNLKYDTKLDLYEYLNYLINIVKSTMYEVTDEILIPNFDVLIENCYLNTYKKLFKKYLNNYLNLFGLIDYIDINKINNLIDFQTSIELDTSCFNFLNNKTIILIEEASKTSLNEIDGYLYKFYKKMLDGIFECDNYLNNNNILSISINDSTNVSSVYFKVISENKYEKLRTIVKISDVDNIDDNLFNIVNSNNIIFNIDKQFECFSNGLFIDSNINGSNISLGKTILSSTCLNLTRIALINRNKPLDSFYNDVSDKLDFIKNQLVQRFDFQANKYKVNFPGLFKYQLLNDIDKVENNQKIRKVFRNGYLNIEIVGLEDSIKIIKNVNSNFKNDLIEFISNKLKKYSEDNKLNFVFSNCSDKNICNELLILDKSIYGSLIKDYNIKNSNISLLNLDDININHSNYNCCYYINKNFKNSKDLKIIIEKCINNNIRSFQFMESKK